MAAGLISRSIVSSERDKPTATAPVDPKLANLIRLVEAAPKTGRINQKVDQAFRPA